MNEPNANGAELRGWAKRNEKHLLVGGGGVVALIALYARRKKAATAGSTTSTGATTVGTAGNAGTAGGAPYDSSVSDMYNALQANSDADRNTILDAINRLNGTGGAGTPTGGTGDPAQPPGFVKVGTPSPGMPVGLIPTPTPGLRPKSTPIVAAPGGGYEAARPVLSPGWGITPAPAPVSGASNPGSTAPKATTTTGTVTVHPVLGTPQGAQLQAAPSPLPSPVATRMPKPTVTRPQASS